MKRVAATYMRRSTLLALLPLVASAAACTAPSDEDSGGSAQAMSKKLEPYWADAKKLDLGDLTRVAVGFATSQLNDHLQREGSGIGLNFQPTEVFAATEDRSVIIPDVSEIHALDTLVSGLAARYGETELNTEVNATRLRHLVKSSDRYFVESAFTASAGLAKDWSFAADGLGDSSIASLGFSADAELSARMILAATDENVATLVKTPLKAAAEARGFVFPRSLAEVRGMKPGEMFALRGLGRMVANFGLGAPILIAEPTAGLTYNIVASAGVRGVVGGQLDVQLIKLDGDEVVVDVGVENGKALSFNAAISDGWGVKGVCDDGVRCLRNLALGKHNVDLKDLVEGAIAKRLNAYLTFKVEGQTSRDSSRVSMSRFRFHLDAGNPDEVEKALQRALKFDVRLAQALYNRDLDQKTPAVIAELDAVRSATTSTRSFGFQLFGMSVYQNAASTRNGSFILQTPEGSRSILFNTVNKHGGWFNDHGFTRTGIAAQTLDAHNPDAFKSEANLFLQTALGDPHMNNDAIIDNVDGLLLGLVGREGVDSLDAAGNAMTKMVWDKCPVPQDQNGTTKPWDEQCNVALLDSPEMKALKAQGEAAFEPFAARLPADFGKIAREAAKVRLTLQSVGIHNLDLANGPNVSFTTDVRLDDKALDILTSRSKEEYTAALRDYLTAIKADRNRPGEELDKGALRSQVDAKWGDQMAAMAKTFEARSAAYREVAAAEAAIPRALEGKRFISYPFGVRFTVDGDSADALKSAVIESTAQTRALTAQALFDDLRSQAGRINAPLYPENTATYPLLSLVPLTSLQVGMDVRADVKSNFWMKRDRYLKAGFTSVAAAAKGAEVSTISAGMFDLDTIIKGD